MPKRTKGERLIASSSRHKGDYLGFQFDLYGDRQGLKVILRVGCFGASFERVWVLKKNPQWQEARPVPQGNPDLTPTVECPEMLAEMFNTKQVEPEDM